MLNYSIIIRKIKSIIITRSKIINEFTSKIGFQLRLIGNYNIRHRLKPFQRLLNG
jgi:hypothetical protein